MSKIETGSPYYCDIDGTLAFDISDLPEGPQYQTITVHCWGRDIEIVPHSAQIDLTEKMYNRGYDIIAHSHSGPEWAEAVCKALGLDPIIKRYMWKSRYYGDDLPCEAWMGERVYREFKP